MKSAPVVVGANSQLGQCLRQRQPHWVYVDRLTLDLLQPQAIAKYFSQRVPLIINFSAFNFVDDAEKKRDEAMRINSAAVGELAQRCDRFIHVSTDYVFSGEKSTPYSESEATGPINFYGETKLGGEKAAFANNPNTSIIRTSWLYSAFSKNFVKRMIELSATRDELKIVDDQIGTPTFAGDLAWVIERMANAATEFGGEIYHFSNQGQCSWYEFAKKIFEFKKISTKVLPIATSEYPTPARRPRYSVLDKSKIANTLGFDGPTWQCSLERSLSNPAFVPELK